MIWYNKRERLYLGSVNLTIEPKVIVDKTSGDLITNKVVQYDAKQKELIKDWPRSQRFKL